VPSSAAEAVAMAQEALGWLAAAGDLTGAARAECLRGLERVESAHTAARASVLRAFSAAADFEFDGHASARSWLKWQTRVTGAAAAGAVGWMRRLAAHRAVGAALAAGEVSASWARQICDWTDQLPDSARGDADLILLAAAAGGAELADLAGLAEEMRRRTARPDEDGDDDGFGDRSVRLDMHLRGAGKLDGDLTPRCAAALRAVLDALGKRAGPEDFRTRWQRQHDALEEACRRLLASGCLPDRAGQSTQIQLHMTLDQLAGAIGLVSASGTDGSGLDPCGPNAACSGACGLRPDCGGPDGGGTDCGGPDGGGTDCRGAECGGAECGGAAFGPEQRSGRTGHPVPAGPVLWPAAGPGDDCDATIVPVLSGHVDPEVMDRLAALVLGPGVCVGQHCDPRPTGDPDDADDAGVRCQAWARELVLREAVALLSGPAGLAAYLRTSLLTGPAASISLPLDTGAATDTIPPHLRRAVIRRDQHCAWPGGCGQPPGACQVHHVVPRSQGGVTALTNLGLFCSFHHLIVIHRWGWSLVLHADGSYTATSPDRTRTLRTHSPPATAA
jgi:hypothetical protein